MNEEPIVRYVAWSPRYPRAPVALTEDGAKAAVCSYILEEWGSRTTWPEMENAGWRVLRVEAQP